MANKQQETPKQTQPTGTTKQGEQTMATTKKETPKQQTTKTKKETNMKQKQQPKTLQAKDLFTPEQIKELTRLNLITPNETFTEYQPEPTPQQTPAVKATPKQPETKTLRTQEMYDIVQVTKSQLTLHSGYNLLKPVRTIRAITVPNGFIITEQYNGNIFTKKYLSDSTNIFTDKQGKQHTTIFHTLKVTETEHNTEYALESTYHKEGYDKPLDYVYTWRLRKTEYTYTPKNGPVTRIKPTTNKTIKE